MERKKVVIFNDYYPKVRGGAEYQAWMLAKTLQDSHFEIVYVSLFFEEDQVFTDENFWKVYGFKSPSSFFDRASLYHFFSKKMTKVLELEKPSFVYQRILNSFSPYIAQVAEKNQLPFFLHIADNYSLEFGSAFRDRVRWHFFKKLLQHPVHYSCQTTFQKSMLERHELEAQILPNLLDIKKTLGALEKSHFALTWIANIRPIKQVQLFIELAKKFEGSNKLRFKIIGRINPQDLIAFKQEVEGISNLSYLGELNTTEVLNELKTTNLLLNTSVSEGFSNTFIQAWSLGIPVLSLNADPNQWLESYEAGFCANGSLGQMEHQIKNYLDNESLYQAHCYNASLLFEREFDFELNKKRCLAYFLQKIEDKHERH